MVHLKFHAGQSFERPALATTAYRPGLQQTICDQGIYAEEIVDRFSCRRQQNSKS